MNVLVFGVFDMLHPGHIYFLEYAQKLGDQLHICLASDEYVVSYKKKETRNNFTQRKNQIYKMFPNVIIHKGDTSLGSWSIFKEFSPNIIALGYDQNELKQAVLNLGLKNVEVISVLPFKESIYKTSLL